MRKIFLIFFLIISTIPLYFFYFYTNSLSSHSVVSPLPQFLTNTFYGVFDSHNYWKPNIIVYDRGLKKPQILALSALSYDLTGEKLLFAKNIKEKVPIASLTKVMTAIVSLENDKVDKGITISKRAETIGEDVMGLSAGEIITLRDLLYGLILHSGNDAAEAIAENSRFGRNNFIYLMNKKAEDLGLSDTHFSNPTGLEGDGKQYSSAYDLLVITRYCLENAQFRDIVSTVEYSIPKTSSHKEYSLFNETNLLTSYPGVKGVKTGFTNEAGMSLATYLEYDGHKIIAILLHSDNRRQEMKDLLDYSLRTLGVNPPPHS